MKESTKQNLIWLGIFAAVVLAIVLFNVFESTVWYNVKKASSPKNVSGEYCMLINSQYGFANKFGDAYADEYDEKFFRNKAVIAFGGRDKGGADVTIKDVYVEGDTLYIDVMWHKPKGGVICIVMPYNNLVTVRKSAIKNVKNVKVNYIEAKIETIFGTI